MNDDEAYQLSRGLVQIAIEAMSDPADAIAVLAMAFEIAVSENFDVGTALAIATEAAASVCAGIKEHFGEETVQ